MTTLVNFLCRGRNIGLFLLALFMTSCNRMADYKRTVRSGLVTLPWPSQMEALFGEGDHFVVHYGFDSEPKEWQTVVYFGGRYQLGMAVDVAIDYTNKTIVKATTPAKFYLWELGKVETLPDGRVSTDFGGGWELDEAQWSKLVAAKGDWSVLGISLKKNDPVPGFDDYVKGEREPRVRVK